MSNPPGPQIGRPDDRCNMEHIPGPILPGFLGAEGIREAVETGKVSSCFGFFMEASQV